MTTVQLSSTFNTVHKNTLHINEQSVYTQGRPRTCDHTKRLYISHSLSHTHSLSHSLSHSFFLPVPVRGRETRAFMYKKDFSARVAGRAKKRKEHATRKYDITRSRNCSRRCSRLKLFLSNFLLT